MAGRVELAEHNDRVRRTFLQFDTDGSGELGLEELQPALTALGVRATAQEVGVLLRRVDIDGSDALSLSEFSELFAIGKLRNVFDEVDADRSGEIDARELQASMRQLGYRLSATEVKDLLAQVDTSNDGLVEFDE